MLHCMYLYPILWISNSKSIRNGVGLFIVLFCCDILQKLVVSNELRHYKINRFYVPFVNKLSADLFNVIFCSKLL